MDTNDSVSGRNQKSAGVGIRRSLGRPTAEQLTAYRKEILERIENDPPIYKFFLKLTQRFKFNPDEIVGGLLDNIFHEDLGRRERLLASPTLPDSLREHMKYLSPGEWKMRNPNPDLSISEKARELADAIEKAEIDTPAYGLDQLDQLKTSAEGERVLAMQEINKLPAILRLYADYFEKSREWWRIIGRIENEARTMFQKASRDLLQEQIHARTGHYSDESYYRLLNIALNVVGLPEIERHALTMRRKRRDSRRRTPA
jgi:hypothetical protein